MSSSTSSSEAGLSWWFFPQSAAVLAAALLLAEGVCRLVSPVYIWNPVEREVMADGPGYPRFVPNAHVRAGVTGVEVDIPTNSDGFMDREVPRDSRLIVGMGNSFVANFGVPTDQTWARALERSLADRGEKNCAARGAGVPGWGAREYYAAAVDLLPRWRPKVVVLLLNHQAKWIDEPAGAGERARAVIMSPLPPTARLALTQRIAALYNTVEAHSAALGTVKRRLPHVGMTLGLFNIYVHPAHRPGDLDPKVAPTLAWLDAFADVVRSHDARLVVAHVPTAYEIDETVYMAILAMRGGGTKDVDLARPNAIVRDWCASRGLAYVDFGPPFKAAQRARPIYDPVDLHWNADGNRLAGEILAPVVAGALH